MLNTHNRLSPQKAPFSSLGSCHFEASYKFPAAYLQGCPYRLCSQTYVDMISMGQPFTACCVCFPKRSVLAKNKPKPSENTQKDQFLLMFWGQILKPFPHLQRSILLVCYSRISSELVSEEKHLLQLVPGPFTY